MKIIENKREEECVMEKISEIFKIFLEKHFMPTVISLVISAIIYVFTPEDFCLFEKFSTLGYWLFVAGIIFILIQSLIFIKSTGRNKKCAKLLQEKNKLAKQRKMKNNLECIWNFVDSLCDEDIKYLKNFLKNKNVPIVVRGNQFYTYGRLFTSTYIISKEGFDNEGRYVKYILTSDFYEFLKFSAEEYGKIGHFEEV